MRGLATKVLDQVWKVDDTITLYKDARLKKTLLFNLCFAFFFFKIASVTGTNLDSFSTYFFLFKNPFQMITHLLRTHLFMEPIAVASYRQLPTIHPLWKLLSPHIRGVLAINTLGRDRLIAEGGVADLTLTVGGGGM